MDAKLWTVGATLFALLYLSLAVTLVWSVVVVALLLAAWVLSLEVEGTEGLKYVELEMRPALSMVGIFGLAVVVLGPHFPSSLFMGVYPVQYAAPMAVLRATPVLFYFPLLPLVAGSVMSVHQRLHPLQGFVYQTPPSPSTKVHVHLHTNRASARGADEEAEDDDEETSSRSRKAKSHHVHLHHRLRRPHQVHAASSQRKDQDEDDESDEEEDEEERPTPSSHHHRKALRANEAAEL